jgi:uncharacterized membrane protein YphA (DoxX/SURF4 family)
MKAHPINNIIAFLLFLAGIALAICLGWQAELNYVFLASLLVCFVLTIVFGKQFPKITVKIARTLLGLLFIFSGFVKGVDPIGTQYQFQDYFTAYGMDWAQPLSLLASFGMNCVEFLIGVLLLFNVKIRIVAWLAALMMALFTGMTFYDALYNSVPDCGCFGKAVHLSNWQTFYKNIVIDIFVVILLFGTKKLKPTFKLKNEIFIGLITVVLFVAFEFYNYLYLPVIDFLDWKKGTLILPEQTKAIKYFATYEKDGVKQEFFINELPADIQDWKFVSMREENPNEASPMLINIFDRQGYDISQPAVIENSIFVCVYDLEHSNFKEKENLLELMNNAEENGYRFVFLTDLKYENDEKSLKKVENILGKEDIDFIFSDDKSIKGLIRSNPGLIQIKDRTIVEKWSCRNIPTEIEQ